MVGGSRGATLRSSWPNAAVAMVASPFVAVLLWHGQPAKTRSNGMPPCVGG